MRRAAALLAALLATGCAAPDVRHSVTQPLAAAAPAEFFLAPPAVASREQDETAQRHNREWGAALAQELRAALQKSGRTLDEASRHAILARIYIVYEKNRLKTDNGTERTPGFVEVELKWKDLDTDALRYGTFTKTSLEATPLSDTFGWGVTREEIIGRTLHAAVTQFVAGLAPAPP